jgi:L-threonylcarbamoyladenylate synthase
MAALRAVCPSVRALDAPAARLETEASRASPGLDPKHYAPRARVVLVPPEDVARTVFRESASGRVGALVRGSASFSPEVLVERLELSPEGYARELFAALHKLDEAGVDTMVVARVPETEEWAAVHDRLTRASS